MISAFEFPLEAESDFIGPLIYSPISKDIKYKYLLSDEDLSELKVFGEQREIPPAYLQLAFKSFLEYYNVEDDKIKFILLMIALENIFIIDDKSVTQTIAKHTALTLTRDEEIYHKKVKRIKVLYDLRSLIVHGNDIKFEKTTKDFPSDVLELEQIVRAVLKQLIWYHKYNLSPKDKDELFNILKDSYPLASPNSN